MRTASPTSPTPSPVPSRPETPKELLDLAGAPLFRGEYSAVERDSWHLGMPVFGRKVTSERAVAFTNEFNVLKTSGPMMGYQASTLEDAIRGAQDLAWDGSDPSLGGQIYASVAVAV